MPRWLARPGYGAQPPAVALLDDAFDLVRRRVVFWRGLEQRDTPRQGVDAHAAGPAHDEPVAVLKGFLAAVPGVAGSTHGEDVRGAVEGEVDVLSGWGDLPVRGGAGRCAQAGVGDEHAAAGEAGPLLIARSTLHLAIAKTGP